MDLLHGVRERMRLLMTASPEAYSLFGTNSEGSRRQDADETDRIAQTVASAFEQWWLTRRERATSAETIATIRLHLSAVTAAIQTLLEDIEAKSSMMNSLETNLNHLRSEYKNAEQVAIISAEEARVFRDELSEALRREASRGRFRRAMTSAIVYAFWALTGAVISQLIPRILELAAHATPDS